MKENFAKTIFRIFFFLCAIFLTLVLFSCFTPSPLYGTWSDNLGNKITFSDDMSYTAIIATGRILDEDSNVLNIQAETFSGSFAVAENVLSLSTEYGLVVTEWDIRGSILYLDWTMPQDHGETIKNLRLYHN